MLLPTGLAALVLTAAAPNDAGLLAQRSDWWAQRDHALDVEGMTPLERVRGGKAVPLPSAGPAQRSIRPEALEAATAYVRTFKTQSLLIWQGGKLQLEWYGPGYDAKSVSSPASMMKPVMAMATGVAIDRGYIRSVDEPVANYLREWKADPRGSITIRQVLQMATGLKKDGSASKPGRGADLMLGTHLEQTLLETEAAEPPGLHFDYNNVNSGLMALILERATRRRYADWLSQAIWRPIGAGDARVWLDRPGGLARSYCCLVTTARDWVRAGLLVKDRGRANGRQVVSAAWIDAMGAGSPLNPNFGFQIWRASPYVKARGYGSGEAAPSIAEAPFAAEDMVFFDGAVGQRVYISRKHDLVIVRIGASAPGWDDSRLPNLILAGLKP